MIKIYSTSWCSYCVKAKKYFKMKGWDYEDIDIEGRNIDRDIVMKISGQRGVPVIDIDGKIIIGFDRERIDEVMKADK